MRCQDNENRSRFIVRLFDAYSRRVIAFSRKHGQADLAEDTTQEVFIKLLQHPKLEDMDVSASYLLKIAQNIMRSGHSRRVRSKRILGRLVMESSHARNCTEETVTETHTVRMNRDQMDEAMQSLSACEREAIRLIVWEGMSYRHAACSLKVNVTTVNNWKFRGLSKLRACVEARDSASQDVFSRQESA